jgi:hypothetical protein
MKMTTLLILFFVGTSTSSSGSNYDTLVADYLKKEKFNLELYEISFCVKELLAVIENDSVYRNAFEKRILRAFDKRLNEAQIYFHMLEYDFLRKQILSVENVKELYPKSTYLVDKMRPSVRTFTFNSFAVAFQNYIEYPEQTDDACIISLVSELPKQIWSEIEADKLANYRFNTWLEFGFEEFRYYPGTKSVAKSTINNRIVSFVNARHNGSSTPLVVKSLKMMRSVVERYKTK